MKEKISKKKEYVVIAIVMALFIGVSCLSLVSIRQLQGNARVINYVGIVRGATQRLVKKELMGYPDDALIRRLDSIVEELITGEGPNNLVVLPDENYLANMRQVQKNWSDIKEEIQNVRNGSDPQQLYNLSEDYFALVDDTVSKAEAYSEHQVNYTTNLLWSVNIIFVVVLLVGSFLIIRSAAVRRRAEQLGKIAYLDPLTQMSNRASCEREIQNLTKVPPENDVAVFMFDMNNLKRVNDALGHQGGDRIIAEFARILRVEGEDYGFVGRYGGDEFIAIFQNAGESVAQNYLGKISEKVVGYNILHINELEKLSFAAGYVIDNMKNSTLEEMINEADHRMYVRKRQMKENDDLY